MKYFNLKNILLVLILGSLAWYLWNVDFQQVYLELDKVGWKFVLIIAVSWISYLLGTFAWKQCFYSDIDIAFSKLFMARTVGETVSFINPTSIVAGEATKYYFLQETNVSKTEVADSIIISRMVLISTQLTVAVVALISMLLLSGYGLQLVVGLILLSIVFLLLGALSKWIGVQRLLDFSFQRFKILSQWHHQFSKFKQRLQFFYASKRHKLYQAAGISFAHWFVGALELYLIVHFLGVDLSFLSCLSIDQGVVLTKSAGGFVPAQIGVEEFANKYFFALMGISAASVWLTVSIIRRARQLFWIATSAVLYFILQYNLKPKRNGSIIYNT